MHQLIMRSEFDDPAGFEHRDLIRVANCAQAMRDDQRRAALHQPPHGFENRLFGNGIQRRGWLIENQNRGVFQECASDREALFLAARQGLRRVRR